MSKWIDASEDVISREWILKEFDKGKPMLYQSEYFAELFWLVRHAPAVTPSLDLVRCAECKHRVEDMCYRVLGGDGDLYKRAILFPTMPDDFCSYGEQKESE